VISSSARRFAFALVLGSTFLASAATAHAGVTGTDPCPPKLMCTTQPPDPAPSASTAVVTNTKTTTSTSTPSSTGTVLQTLMVLLGIS
jgi:hypothetical protein